MAPERGVESAPLSFSNTVAATRILGVSPELAEIMKRTACVYDAKAILTVSGLEIDVDDDEMAMVYVDLVGVDRPLVFSRGANQLQRGYLDCRPE